jgi:hypothetical protein
VNWIHKQKKKKEKRECWGGEQEKVCRSVLELVGWIVPIYYISTNRQEVGGDWNSWSDGPPFWTWGYIAMWCRSNHGIGIVWGTQNIISSCFGWPSLFCIHVGGLGTAHQLLLLLKHPGQGLWSAVTEGWMHSLMGWLILLHNCCMYCLFFLCVHMQVVQIKPNSWCHFPGTTTCIQRKRKIWHDVF